MTTTPTLRAALCLLAAVCGHARAQQAASWPGIPALSSLTPRGGQSGATVKVEFTGSRLRDPRSVLCVTTDRIRCTGITVAEPEADSRGRRRSEPDSRVVATLEIAPDCPQGFHGLRVQTAGGLSDLRLFCVGRLPEAMEKEAPDATTDANGTAQTAEALALPSTVNGHLGQIAGAVESDTWRVTLRKGQVLTAELAAARLASQEREDGFEASLTVRNAAGEVIAQAGAVPFLLTDPFVSCIAPADGDYWITVGAALPPEGSRRVPYRLSVAAARRPTAVYPSGGNPGASLPVRLLGLPEGADTAAVATLPEQPGDHAFHADPDTPSPNRLRVLAGPNVLEQEPNPDEAKATPVPDAAAPFAVNGILESPGDTDVFRFTAKKDTRLHIRAFSQALGSPADLRFTIARVRGGGAERADDAGDEIMGLIDSGTVREKLDPALIWKAPADGDYFLTVSDSRGLGGPDFVYRVEFTDVADGLLTSLSPVDNNARLARSTVNVGRGSRVLAMIAVRPAPGASPSGTWELEARGLPPGVTMRSEPFQAADRRVPVMFETAPDATMAAANVRILAKPAGGDVPAGSDFRQTVPLLLQGNDALAQLVQPALSLAVTDEIPFAITVSEPPSALARNGELELEVTLTRKPGFTQALDVLLEQPPRGVIGQQGVILANKETRTAFRLSAQNDAAPGTHRIALTVRNREGDSRTGAGKLWSASTFIPLEVSDPWLRVKFPRARIEQGRRATLTGTIEKLRDLPGKATASLIRLPRGVSLASPVTIGDAGTVSFEVESSPDALVGSYSGMACEITVEKNGRTLKQVAGYGSLRVDPARVAE